MIVTVQRIKDNGISTTGQIQADHIRKVTIEDTGRDMNHDGDLDDPGEGKIQGVTRIPAGRYPLRLRTWGGKHEEYERRYNWHIGMLWICDVPGFSDVLIHIGNTAIDSRGCILIGTVVKNDDCISGSTKAYEEFYQYVAPRVEEEESWIEIHDEPKL